MRAVADAERIRRFMHALGAAARTESRVYFAGGATAVLLGWRTSTIDIDLTLGADADALLRAIPDLKESLHVNVELAGPPDFIPVPTGWEDRSPFIERVGRLAFHNFDLSAQALAKIERGHTQDLADVREMLARGLITAERTRADFERIVPLLYRYPAVDPASFRRAVEEALPDTPQS